MNAFILINNETLEVLKATKTIEQAQFWAEILAPSQDYLITGALKRDYSCFTQYELGILYQKLAHQFDLGGASSEAIAKMEYNKVLSGVHDLINKLDLDETGVKELRERLGRDLIPVDPTPVPDKGGRPAAVKGPTSGPTSPTRPGEGTTTGKVWAIADNVLASGGGPVDKNFRAIVIGECSKAGISPSTAATQYSKWKKDHESK